MRWPSRHSLAWRLGFGFALALLLMGTLYAGLQWLLAERFSGFVTRMSLAGQVEDIVEGLQVDAQGRVTGLHFEDAIDRYAFDAYYANLKYRVLDARGQVVASNEAGAGSLLPDVPLAAQGDYFGQHLVQGQAFQVAAWTREVQGHRFVFQLGRSDRFNELAREAIGPAVTETALLLTVLGAFSFCAVGVLGVRRALRPLHATARAAEQLDHRRLDQRLPEQNLPDEIRPLVTAFNATLARLQLGFDAQQRFFANAAHELKTPLAHLRSQVDAGLPASALQPGLDAMARRIQQLLQLAEASDVGLLRMAEVNLQDAGAEVVQQLGWKAEARQVTLQYQHPPQVLRCQADAGALFTLLKNLLENALDFSPPGSVVRLALSASGFTVDDQGPGVPPAWREQVFERFWRAPDQARDGAGLGLALCREIADAHGWRLHCEAAPGGGARFVLGVAEGGGAGPGDLRR